MIGILYQFIVANEILGTNYDVQHFIQYMQRLDYPLDIISQLNFDDTYRFMLLDKRTIKKVSKWFYFKIGVNPLLFMLIRQHILKHFMYYNHI